MLQTEKLQVHLRTEYYANPYTWPNPHDLVIYTSQKHSSTNNSLKDYLHLNNSMQSSDQII